MRALCWTAFPIRRVIIHHLCRLPETTLPIATIMRLVVILREMLVMDTNIPHILLHLAVTIGDLCLLHGTIETTLSALLVPEIMMTIG